MVCWLGPCLLLLTWLAGPVSAEHLPWERSSHRNGSTVLISKGEITRQLLVCLAHRSLGVYCALVAQIVPHCAQVRSVPPMPAQQAVLLRDWSLARSLQQWRAMAARQCSVGCWPEACDARLHASTCR